MLDRTAPGRRRAARARKRQAAYRKRLQANRVVVPVEVDGPTVNFLIRTRWLPAKEHHSRAELGAAIGRLLADSAQ